MFLMFLSHTSFNIYCELSYHSLLVFFSHCFVFYVVHFELYGVQFRESGVG